MTITRVVILAAGIISMGTSTQLMAGRQESEQPRVIGRWDITIAAAGTSLPSWLEPSSEHLGGVYGFLAPNENVARQPGEWQTFDITLVGRLVTVVLNGTTVIGNQEIPGITGGASMMTQSNLRFSSAISSVYFGE